MFSGMAGLLAALAVTMLNLNLLVIVLSGLAAAAVPFVHVWLKRGKRFDKFLEDLPDALELMSRALSAGHGFAEAMHMVSTEMPEPIATEFRKTYEEQNLGLSLKLALENLTQRIPLLDLRMCVTAVLIQRETGGNLSEILKRWPTHSRTLSHHGRPEDPDNQLAPVRLDPLWLAYFCRPRRKYFEPGLHGCFVE